MDHVGRPMGACRATDTEAPTGQGTQVQASARRGSETDGTTPGVCGDRVRAANGLPMEGSAEGIRQRQFGTCVLPEVEALRRVCEDVATRVGGV